MTRADGTWRPGGALIPRRSRGAGPGHRRGAGIGVVSGWGGCRGAFAHGRHSRRPAQIGHLVQVSLVAGPDTARDGRSLGCEGLGRSSPRRGPAGPAPRPEAGHSDGGGRRQLAASGGGSPRPGRAASSRLSRPLMMGLAQAGCGGAPLGGDAPGWNGVGWDPERAAGQLDRGCGA